MFLLIISSGLLRKRKDVVYFSAFLCSLIVWLSLLWVADLVNEGGTSLVFLRIALGVGSFAPLFFFVFAEKFASAYNATLTWLFAAMATLFGVLSLTNLMVPSLSKGEIGVHLDVVTPIYSLQTLYTFVVFATSIFWIRKHIDKENVKAQKQARLIALFALLAVIIGILGGTVISKSEGSNLLSPLAVTIFAAGSFIAIFKHGLFDIRLIVARFTAYVFLIATLSGIYALAVFGIANHFLGTESVFAQQVVPIVSAIFLVFTAPFFKRLFDRITNRLFYQDAYDPQTLLDDLNKVLLGNIELSILLRHASTVIQQHLKSEMCLVAVKQVSSAPMRIVGTMDPHLSEEDTHILRHDLAKQEAKITSVEDIPVHGRLSRLLKAKNIAVVVRLQTSHDTEGDALAYLILGPKRSGNIYNKQDFRIIEIIADEMVIAIQNALRFEEIQGFAATLQERVNEATAKLKRTNAKLKEMDETKDEFISMASHQLRTPLTSVKGYLSMVLEGDAGKVSAGQQKLLDQAFISSQRMVYLIADLLNVSRLKTGKFVITSAPTSLVDMVEGELGQLTEVAKGKKVKLTYKKPKDFTPLMLDETKIRQVVMNFADNAIYYTPSGGKVDVEVKEDRNNVYFTVKDNGMGIPREEQKHLFTKFYRASNARQVRPDGTGLGLFMAKKVVAAQGGTILFESTEGKGSTFGFSFSKSKLKVPAAKS